MLKNYITPFLDQHSLTIIDIGEEERIPGDTKLTPPRMHYIIHFVVSGTGKLTLINPKAHTENELTENVMFSIYKGNKATYFPTQKNHLHYYWIGFDGDEGEKIMQYIGFSPEHPVLSVKNPQEVISAFRALFSIWKNKNVYGLLEKFFSLIRILQKNNTSAEIKHFSITPQNEIALQAKQYIQDNLQKNISVNDVAAALNITRNYFSKVFKESFQITPHEYIARARLKRAEALLRVTNYRISEIADFLGFPDIYTFSKLFKKIYKKTPLQFRNHVNNKNN